MTADTMRMPTDERRTYVAQLVSEWSLYDDDDARREALTRWRDGTISEDDQASIFVDALKISRRAADVATAHAQQEADGQQEKAETDRETAAKLACGAELFCSTEGVEYATMDVDGHRETVPVRSRRFKAWLTRAFREAKGKAPSSDALNTAQTEAEANALLSGVEHEVFTRLGHRDGRVYLDMCDPTWRAIEIDATGWRIVDEPPVKFHRPADALPLPEPVRGGSLEMLRPFINTPEDADWLMAAAWLVGAMAPDGPYPLLVLYGEQGSAKSSTSRRLRSVIDPARTETRETPKNTHDLAIAARGCWVLAYDNLSYLRGEMSDAMCRLATGGGFGTRRLYSDSEEMTFYAKRPLILNGIEEVATRGDLLSRSIVLQLPTLETVRDERTLNAEWAEAHPAILGALLDATVKALAGWESADLGGRAPRMADFARWVVASKAVPGFLDLYAINRDDAINAEIDSSPFASALMDFAREMGEWEGRARDLLDRLSERLDDDRPKFWPKDATRAAGQVRRFAPALRQRGVEISERKSNGAKLIVLRAEADERPGLAL